MHRRPTQLTHPLTFNLIPNPAVLSAALKEQSRGKRESPRKLQPLQNSLGVRVSFERHRWWWLLSSSASGCVMDTIVMQGSVLVLTDLAVLPTSAVLNAIKVITNEGMEQIDPLIITQASLLSQLPRDSSSVDIIIFICRSSEFPGDELFGEISRVLKPGGTVLLHQSSESATGAMITSTFERKLLVAGFLDVQVFTVKPVLQSKVLQTIGIKAKKPSWKIGSSFALKTKPTKSLPKLQIDNDMDLIDEDSLLTEEDLKKPQLPPIGDCEVGSTRKACKNCSCGRAEAEEKVQKLGPTIDQLDNPQSACGNCGLGDAFRCSTCPYKGLPAFKLGEKVALSGNFLTADI